MLRLSRTCGLCAAAVLVLVLGVIHSVTFSSSSATLPAAPEPAAGTHTGRRLHQAPVPARSPAAAPAAKGNTTRKSTNATSPASGAPQLCKWSQEEGSCGPTHQAWKSAGVGMPSSPYRRAVLMASERDQHCSQHTTPQACAADWQMRCFRQGGANATNARCASSDMEEMLVWSGKGFMSNLSLIPHAMTCPGSPARAFFDCYAFAGRLDACKALPRCKVLASLGALKNICIPRAWLQMKMRELRQVLAGLETLSPAVYGTCGAACWLREARDCSRLTSKQACSTVSYCAFDEVAALRARSSILMPMWDDGGDGDDVEEPDLSSFGSRPVVAKSITAAACRHQSQEFSSSNPVDQAAQRIYKQCSGARNETACKGVKASTPAPAGVSRAPMVNWRLYEPSNTSVKCRSTGTTTAAGR